MKKLHFQLLRIFQIPIHLLQFTWLVCFAISPMFSTAQENSVGPNNSGPYLGQPDPGPIPVLFAPSVIIPNHATYGYFGITFSPDGLECFYGEYPDIMTTKEVDGEWTDPAVASFSGIYNDMEAIIIPDNTMLYFSSDRPLTGAPPMIDRLWSVERTGTGWSNTVPIPPPLQNVRIMFPSFAANGNLYFSTTDDIVQWIALSRYIDGMYQPPEKLDDHINFNNYTGHSFIAPDESYMILDVLDHFSGSYPCRDLYVSFRNPDSTWSPAISLGDTINTYDGNEVCPFVSRDNKYLFFTRNGNIYWVQAPDFLPHVGTNNLLGYDPNILVQQNYPNPANNRTTIEFTIRRSAHIRLSLSTVYGWELKVLLDEKKDPGTYRIQVDLQCFKPGIYVYQLGDGTTTILKKMLLH